MKAEGFLSLKDYFNYYISGLLLCLSFLFFELSFLGWVDLAPIATKLSDGVEVVIAGMIIVIVPYVVGFVLLPINEWIRKLWQGGKERKWRHDPREHLFQLVEGSEAIKGFEKKRITYKETKQILSAAKIAFNIEYKKDIRFYFYPIRAFVLEYGGKSAILIDRARDLANFTESLLLPIPLAIISLGFYLLSRIFVQYWGSLLGLFIIIVSAKFLLLLSWGLAIGAHYLLVKRYFQLEEYWVKHVYRAFLVLTSENPDQVKKNKLG